MEDLLIKHLKIEDEIIYQATGYTQFDVSQLNSIFIPYIRKKLVTLKKLILNRL